MIRAFITMALLSVITLTSSSQVILPYAELLENNYSTTILSTCFDGIQNQGELSIDCGGPCPLCEVDALADIGQSNAAARLGDVFSSTDIPIFNNVHIYNSNITNNAIVPMVISSNSGESYTDNGDQGNYGMGTIKAAQLDNYYVLKLAYGGVGLDASSGSPNWSINSTGQLYDEFVADYNDFKSELNALGKDPVMKYVIWSQGERDATNSVWASNYENNMTNLIGSLNILFGLAPKWRLARIRTDINPSSYPHRAVVRQAIENLASTLSFVEIIDMDSNCTIPDQVHYDGQCIITKGLSIN